MRSAQITRTTKETDITIALQLDGEGKGEISTGIGFFDHMLTALKVHGGLNLDVCVHGDLEVDGHHTIEDTGIVLGQAIAKALGDKGGIERYGNFFAPMDEALGFCAMDISGRPFLVFEANFKNATMGNMETAMVEEFFRALCFQAGITLHLKVLYGKNDHHKCEALFKCFAHALRQAIRSRNTSLPLSTKGVL